MVGLGDEEDQAMLTALRHVSLVLLLLGGIVKRSE